MWKKHYLSAEFKRSKEKTIDPTEDTKTRKSNTLQMSRGTRVFKAETFLEEETGDKTLERN